MMMNFLLRNLVRRFNTSVTRGYFAICIIANNCNEHNIYGLLTKRFGQHDWIFAKFVLFLRVYVQRRSHAPMLDNHAKMN